MVAAVGGGRSGCCSSDFGCLSLSFGQLFGLSVALIIELLEEEPEHDSVHADPPDEGAGVVAVNEEQLEGVDHDGHELSHLQDCDVFLPPEVLLN